MVRATFFCAFLACASTKVNWNTFFLLLLRSKTILNAAIFIIARPTEKFIIKIMIIAAVAIVVANSRHHSAHTTKLFPFINLIESIKIE